MNLNTPKPFTPQANRIGKDWQLWKQEFKIFLKLSGAYENLTEENRAYLLLNLMGQEGIKGMENMKFDHPNEKHDMDILIMKFDEVFDTPLNEAEERFKFFSRRKKENETIENFVADLKEKADTCNFGTQSDKFIIDMIIRSVDNYLRKIIFDLEDISIQQLIQYYNQYSANTDKIKEITQNLNKVGSSDKKPQPRPCWRCNTRHIQRNCPAYGSTCNICNEKNHFSGLCKKESESTTKRKTEIPQKRICSKCGTNHPYQQCPAHDYVCFKCYTKGHFDHRCKNTPMNSTKKDEQTKKTEEIKSKPTTKPSEKKDLPHCLWCNSKHNEGHCPHNQNCTICDKFPHNICFNCKKNPHEISCYYKTIVTLPAQTINLNNTTQTTTSSHIVNKNQENTSNRSSTSSSYCHLCLKVSDHTADNCPKKINNVQKTSQPATSDPLLRDYVKVNQNTPRSAQYQASTSRPQQTKPANDYRNNLQFQNNHYKRNHSKPDTCSIS